jgi:hypothetical protein
MRALSATELLGVWEREFSQPPVRRALALLAAACPESPPDDLAELSIGQRDARLVALRELTFGTDFTGRADCPACGENLELAFRAADFLPIPAPEPPAELALQVEGGDLRFRLPTSADLLEIGGGEPAPAGRDRLLERCLLAGRDHLPDQVLDLVAARMAEADPLADIQFALACPACGHEWRANFDIVAFFWREIHAWVRGLLREVHTLASIYGWCESDILALSPARRRLYLEMVGG